MWDRTPTFVDRYEAGRRLAQELVRHLPTDDAEPPLILALPRGGVVIGYEVARALGAPLDVIVARKLGAPMQQELGIGAIAPGGVRVIDERIVRHLGISPSDIDTVVERETAEMERRETLYRGDSPPPRIEGRTVVLVDDGLATGVTARAACRSIRQGHPCSLILAAPVCAPESVEAMRAEADEIVCLLSPRDFAAVGLWYRDFDQTTDEEVLELLARNGVAVRLAALGSEGEIMDGSTGNNHGLFERPVEIFAKNVTLNGDLTVPSHARGVVLFAHGSGSSRHSARNRSVARILNENRLATLLIDLLTPQEEVEDNVTAKLRFDVDLLAGRLIAAAEWLKHKPETTDLRVGYFGASTGGGAALIASAHRPDLVSAVVSRGGRPDLAGDLLAHVYTPTLLIVGGNDDHVITLNQAAFARIPAEAKRLEIVPGATHLFEEPGALDEVARLAAEWFVKHLDLTEAARAA